MDFLLFIQQKTTQNCISELFLQDKIKIYCRVNSGKSWWID